MFRIVGVALMVLITGVAAISTASARSADQLPPLAVTAEDLGPGFLMADEETGLIEPNSFVRVLQRTSMGFTSVSVVLYGETTLTPEDAVEQAVQGIVVNPAAAGLAAEAIAAPQGYGADVANFALGGMVGNQQFKVLVTGWRSDDVVAVVTAAAVVAAPESAEQVAARLLGYADAQRDKLTAMGLALATTASTPAQP